MRIEALAPLRLKFKNGDTQSVQAGEIVNLPGEYGLRLLEKAAGKVRAVEGPMASKTPLDAFVESLRDRTRGSAEERAHRNWLSTWQALAELTVDIDKTDPRFNAVLAALEECDRCFEAGDWTAFEIAAERVRQVVMGSK